MTNQQSVSASNVFDVPWYRRNGWVTAMVAGIIFIGPLLALPVFAILCTGQVYYKGGNKPWDSSTKWLVLLFALVVNCIWCYQVYSAVAGNEAL